MVVEDQRRRIWMSTSRTDNGTHKSFTNSIQIEVSIKRMKKTWTIIGNLLHMQFSVVDLLEEW